MEGVQAVRSSTETLINAMRIVDGVVLVAIAEAVQRMEEQQERIAQLEQENDALRADLLLWGEKEVKL